MPVTPISLFKTCHYSFPAYFSGFWYVWRSTHILGQFSVFLWCYSVTDGC